MKDEGIPLAVPVLLFAAMVVLVADSFFIREGSEQPIETQISLEQARVNCAIESINLDIKTLRTAMAQMQDSHLRTLDNQKKENFIMLRLMRMLEHLRVEVEKLKKLQLKT